MVVNFYTHIYACSHVFTEYNPSLLPWKQRPGHNIATVDIAFDVAWSTTNFDNIYINLNGKWTNVAGKLSQITIGESGVLGVAPDRNIFSRTGVTESNPTGTDWYHDVSGLLTQITSGPPGINKTKQNETSSILGPVVRSLFSLEGG